MKVAINITMNAKEIRTFIGIIGNVISSFISLSHTPKFIEIYKKKSVEKFEEDLHLGLVGKYSLWLWYGLPFVTKDNILVSTSNGVGFVIEVIYVIIFWIYCEKQSSRMQKTKMKLLCEFSFVLWVYWLTFGCYKPYMPTRHIFVGVSCILFTILMHAIVGANTIDKDTNDNKRFRCKCMPFWLSCVSFINSGIWTAYSLLYKIDIYILIASSLGMLACASQVLIVHPCLLYRRIKTTSANVPVVNSVV